MSKLKRLATKEDNIVVIESPITSTELSECEKDYPLLFPSDFAKKYRDLLFQPVKFHFKGQPFLIQFNRCTNPFCKWFGETQKRFEDLKYKPSRYKIVGSAKHNTQAIQCNPDPTGSKLGTTWNCTCVPYSNWSVAEEIARLAALDKVENIEVEYEFHKEDCEVSHLNPFKHSGEFYRRGKSSGNSQKWQCKKCKKITNVMPSRRESTTYHQKRNDILPDLAAQLLNRTPVKRSCEMLGIGSKTYYSKLEWLYRRCLEFLERHEAKAFESINFDKMWVNTDKMIYNLNNVRKGGQRFDDIEEQQFPTHIVVSGDVGSRYIFRSDVAYDWDVRVEDIYNDTILYKDDHLDDFSQKNARLRFSFSPQPPTKNDTESYSEYLNALHEFDRRNKYIEGLHVNSTYTTMAHYFHIKLMVNAKEWRFVSDDDSSIITALFRVFAREIKRGAAHHFLSKIDRNKSRKDAYREYVDAREELKSWGGGGSGDESSITKLAVAKLISILRYHDFYEMVKKDGSEYRKWAKKPIEHPLPSIDQGKWFVDCTTDLSSYEIEHVANMLVKVNDKATSAFMQQIRRRLSILERPLVTARGEGKSYIYANFNPKYAQYVLTILRTFYNFCLPYNSWDKVKATPAQRLGIADKQFTMKDIIYFK
ncbi:insertion element protein [Bacillus sp. DX4.1]|uniref:insertion element protein n=1 Tax=Bacillus sp. DX4.1 TaxID=3055867 RepID=UPI0025A174EA|nr:insertion element protein [Bacillus sp. DX4.1]MDM5188045.1 insertion element protein [Bacillus sp. DX4.1]